jgi:thioesterase domain-containing protein
MLIDLAELRRRDPEERLRWAVEEARARGALNGLDLDQARRLSGVLAANMAALLRYRPEPWPGRAVFYRAAERRQGDPDHPELPWVRLARGGVEVVEVPGDHQSMHRPPQVVAMARHLRAALDLRHDPRALGLLLGAAEGAEAPPR